MLDIDTICAAIRARLEEAANREVQTALPTLVLQGVPDELMKDVLDSCGGVLRIEVRELPAEFTGETPAQLRTAMDMQRLREAYGAPR